MNVAHSAPPDETPPVRRGGPRYTDSAPVARLLRKWHRQGITYEAIARQTGVSACTLTEILSGQRPQVKYSTVRRLTGLDPDKALRDSGGLNVDALATVRMLRALVAIGHPCNAMAAGLGMSVQHFSDLINGKRPYVRQGTAWAAKRMYDARSMTLGGSVFSRNRALRRGWAPPLAWEYLDMSDPAAVACGYTDIDHANNVA